MSVWKDRMTKNKTIKLLGEIRKSPKDRYRSREINYYLPLSVRLHQNKTGHRLVMSSSSSSVGLVVLVVCISSNITAERCITWFVSNEQTALITGDSASVVELSWNGGMPRPSRTNASTFIHHPRKYLVIFYTQQTHQNIHWCASTEAIDAKKYCQWR